MTIGNAWQLLLSLGMKQNRKGLPHTIFPVYLASAVAALPELRRRTEWAFEDLVEGCTFPS